MKYALGMLEVYGFALAVEIADTMLKTAEIQLEDIKITRGIGWLTIAVEGNVGAVNAAILAGTEKAKAMEGYISSKVIPRPITNVFGETSFDELKQVETDNPAEKPKELQVVGSDEQLKNSENMINKSIAAIENTPKNINSVDIKMKTKSPNGKKKVKEAKRSKEEN